jgi:Tfp pilus assembly protein PilP
VRYLTSIAVTLTLLILPCLGQSPRSQPDRNAAKGKQAPGGYLQRNNKRDPFKPLITKKEEKPKEVTALPKFRPAGLPGLAVSEVMVIGIAANKNARIAVLQSKEGKEKLSYFAKVGDKLFNGSITAIDADKVTFTEEFTSSDGKKSQKTLTKKLYAEM